MSCELLVDVAIETGTVSGNNNQDAVPVTCDTGRVILAATAHLGSSGTTTTPVPVALADGALTDTANVLPNTSGTIRYYLTTGRVATL
jgi:hypothetical protein